MTWIAAAVVALAATAAGILAGEGAGRQPSKGERSVNTSLPYPRRPVIRAVHWDEQTIRIGNNAGDNWPITWGEGDVQYTAYGDGRGFSDRKPRLSLGFARILGDPPNHRGEDVVTDIDTPEGQGPRGIKASGLLMVDGVLFLFVRNYRVGDNWRHSRLAWSKDA